MATASLMMPHENKQEGNARPHLVLSLNILKKSGGRILNKAFLSLLLDSRLALETRWFAMGTTIQGNVCNHGIVRRFGHSQNVAYVQVGNKPNLNLWILLFWREMCEYYKTLYKIISKGTQLGAHAQVPHWQLLKYADVYQPGQAGLDFGSQFAHLLIPAWL